MSEVERLGIFGGTFDPPHSGHIYAARTFLDQLELDRLLIMPACIPPHKKISATDDPKVRLEMVNAAFGELSEKVTVSDYEIKKSGVSYTVDTLEHFTKQGRTLFLLCGTDMFLSLDTWRSPERIFDLVDIVCIPRNDSAFDEVGQKAKEYKSRFNAKCHILNAPPLEISSTELRDQIAQGSMMDEYIPERVRIIIERENLYK